MWAILAAIAFFLGLVFHIAGGSVAQYWVDAELTGLICLSIHLIWGVYPWRRTHVPPQ